MEKRRIKTRGLVGEMRLGTTLKNFIIGIILLFSCIIDFKNTGT